MSLARAEDRVVAFWNQGDKTARPIHDEADPALARLEAAVREYLDAKGLALDAQDIDLVISWSE